MKLEHSFTVPVGIDEAWRILLDVERIGPCMPGAAVDSVDGDDFTGSVKVKLGPIGLTYKGKASFVEKDAAAHRAVIDARGKDARGNGTAAAKVTATLSERGGETHVQVDTDLDITGKPAQFGRGVMVDVGNKLIGIFADNLAEEIRSTGGRSEPAAAPAAPAKKAARKAPVKKAAAAAKAPAKKAAAKTAAAAKSAAAPAGKATAGAPVAEPGQPQEQPATPPAAPPAAEKVAATAAATVNGAATRAAAPREVEPIDLMASAGPAVAKRLAPPLLALLVVLFVIARRRKS